MSSSPGNTALHLGALSLLLVIAACSKPQPPDKEQPPQPQAAQAETHTELRDAIRAPIDRAKAVSPAVLDAAQKQRDDIDAQTGAGDATPPQ
jgi:hypothetical protein